MSEVLSSTPSNPQTSEGANTQNRGRGRGRGGRGGRGTRGSRGGNRGRKTTTQTSSQRPNTRAKPKDDVSASNDHNYLFFWKPKGPHGWASQWHAESFTAKVTIPNKNEPEDVLFQTAENYMMYRKALLFGDVEIANKILKTTSPVEVRSLGRKVSPFDNDVWLKSRYEIVRDGNMAKFKSSAACAEKLLETGGQYIVEASPLDSIWGIGFTAQKAIENREKWGTNLLGKVLMEVRDELRKGREEQEQAPAASSSTNTTSQKV